MENHETGNQKHDEEDKVVHCLILPFPAQGHINPMLQFSKRLEAKGVKITIAVTKFLLTTLQDLSSSHLSIETISDGFDEGCSSQTRSSQAYIDKFREVGSETLAQVLRRLRVGRFPVSCVVYDAFLPWVVDVAVEEGVSGACFFTQSCAVDGIYYYCQQGRIKVPLGGDEVVEIPGLPCLEPKDMPSFIYSPESSYPFALEMLMNQFCNIQKADWILVNTFYELERQVIDWMRKLWVVGAIGPTVPSKYLDNRLPDDKEYGLSVFKPMTEVCMKWLDDRQDGSVVYVSFGSMVHLQEEQMEELAWALRRSNRPFLWVVRSEEANKLPKNFLEEKTRGLVVSWCPQLQVLAHSAVGCFLTHCGWNSTLEAISLGVPMIAIPQWSDQATNSKLVMDKWKTGVRAKTDENGVVKREEIEECIGRVMEEEEMRANTRKWKQVCKEAMEEGGTSDRDIQDFISCLAAKSMTK
ncbi:UDP-glycosyltransferase 74G1-like isoform X1 [Ipomoea triloba]|uniref:UDP-glycosyltransferase 74G1-like isoform X1 n=1 Tax=Ipomoea triloba TaxID=35885 RepID=UPI00125CEC33|nr:UDP-glycosyltransferase 74G1-like isoform X1 [Ipomoea triloba]